MIRSPKLTLAALLIAGAAAAQTPDVLFDENTTFEDLFPDVATTPEGVTPDPVPQVLMPDAAPQVAEAAPDYFAICLADPSNREACYLANLEESDGSGDPDEIRLETVFIDYGGGAAAETEETPQGAEGSQPVPVAVGPTVTSQPTAVSGPGVSMVETEILFAYDSAEIELSELLKIDRLANALNSPAASAQSFVVVGHTDSVGSDWYNCALSLRRAQALNVALADRGVAPSRLVAIGAGEHLPRNTYDTTAAENRRVGFAPLGIDAAATLDELTAICGY